MTNICTISTAGLYFLLLTHITHSFVLLTANVEDVKQIARKFVSDSLAEKITDFIAKATETLVEEQKTLRKNKARDSSQVSTENRMYNVGNTINERLDANVKNKDETTVTPESKPTKAAPKPIQGKSRYIEQLQIPKTTEQSSTRLDVDLKESTKNIEETKTDSTPSEPKAIRSADNSAVESNESKNDSKTIAPTNSTTNDKAKTDKKPLGSPKMRGKAAGTEIYPYDSDNKYVAENEFDQHDYGNNKNTEKARNNDDTSEIERNKNTDADYRNNKNNEKARNNDDSFDNERNKDTDADYRNYENTKKAGNNDDTSEIERNKNTDADYRNNKNTEKAKNNDDTSDNERNKNTDAGYQNSKNDEKARNNDDSSDEERNKNTDADYRNNKNNEKARNNDDYSDKERNKNTDADDQNQNKITKNNYDQSDNDRNNNSETEGTSVQSERDEYIDNNIPTNKKVPSRSLVKENDYNDQRWSEKELPKHKQSDEDVYADSKSLF